MKVSNIDYKRSQTNIIIVVLLFLIGIAAVVVISGFVINFVRENLQTATPADIFIVKDDPPTWNNETNSVYLTISRSPGGDLSAVQFVVYFGENSKSFMNLIIPAELEKKMYVIPFSEYMGVPNIVEIAPVVEVNGAKKQFPVTSSSPIVVSNTVPFGLETSAGWIDVDLPPEPVKPE